MNISPPTIIDGPGEYETRLGERIKIIEVGPKHTLRAYAKANCVGSYPNGVFDWWTHQGFIWKNKNCDNDIVKKIS